MNPASSTHVIRLKSPLSSPSSVEPGLELAPSSLTRRIKIKLVFDTESVFRTSKTTFH